MWKRQKERAQELKLTIPDPCVVLNALDAIAANVIKEDTKKTFRVERARETIGVDVVTR